MTKPRSKTETRHAAIPGGRDKRAYYAGSKPFMKRKQAKARRRTDRNELDTYPSHDITAGRICMCLQCCDDRDNERI